MNIGPTSLRRARAVFHCALELEGLERDLFVSDACGVDPQLESLVRRLLAADSLETNSFGGRWTSEL